MPYHISLQDPDTKSLLDLANHTNPETIGELLTYDKIDIKDFIPSDLGDIDPDEEKFLVEENNGTIRAFYGIDSIASKYNTTAAIINQELEKPGNPMSFENMYDLLRYTSPETVDEKTGNEFFIRNGTKLTSDYYYSKAGTSLVAEYRIKRSTLNGSLRLEYESKGGSITLDLQTNDDRTLATGRIQSQHISSITQEPVLDSILNIRITISEYSANININGSMITRLTYKQHQNSLFTVKGKHKLVSYYDEIAMIDSPALNNNISVKNWNGVVDIPGVMNMAKYGDAIGLISGREIIEPVIHDSVLLVNRSYAKDDVRVKYLRLKLNDLLDLPADSDDWNWYDSDEWVQARDIPLAIQMLKDVIGDIGGNTDKIMRNLTAERLRIDEHWYLRFTFESLIIADGISATFKMPHQFSDIVTIKTLNGFIYSPILESAVIV